MYLYKTDNFLHIYHYLKSVSKVALLHRFYCIHADYYKQKIEAYMSHGQFLFVFFISQTGCQNFLVLEDSIQL